MMLLLVCESLNFFTFSPTFILFNFFSYSQSTGCELLNLYLYLYDYNGDEQFFMCPFLNLCISESYSTSFVFDLLQIRLFVFLHRVTDIIVHPSLLSVTEREAGKNVLLRSRKNRHWKLA